MSTILHIEKKNEKKMDSCSQGPYTALFDPGIVDL